MDLLPKAWNRLSKLPGGKWTFSQFIGRIVPYSGTIGAEVEELREGYARVKMKDRRKVRNHLNSIHAVALLNLGELVSGMAYIFNLPSDMRAIAVGMEIEYHKKARGTLTAEAKVPLIRKGETYEQKIEALIYNDTKEKVATFHARWRVGPKNK